MTGAAARRCSALAGVGWRRPRKARRGPRTPYARLSGTMATTADGTARQVNGAYKAGAPKKQNAHRPNLKPGVPLDSLINWIKFVAL